MISTDELIYEFKLTLNKVNRQDNVEIPLEDIIVYLNKAQMSWVKTKLNPNNVYKMGYEAIRKRIDDVQGLKKSNVPLAAIKTNDLFHLGYECSLNDVDDYMFYISSYALAEKKKCKEILNLDLIKTGDLTTRYLDVNYNPSFEWRNSLLTIGDNKLVAYTDGSFTISSIYMTYLRYPKAIDKEGYVKLDGTDSISQDSELPDYAKSDIVDLAVKFAAQTQDNQTQAAFAEDRLNKNTE